HGLALAQEVRSRRPTLPIILMSGYNDAVPTAGCPFRVLRKPVPFQELRSAVGTYLTPRPGRFGSAMPSHF
ncbi:MAG: hypothetical protein KGL35_00870, partial [Bradyrhizobium sp.]|nr:hypothetical protein [Bradyrhizobium sp.]